jgi:hypothetical protein
MTAKDYRRSRRWRNLRAWTIANAIPPVICWRCEQEITDVAGADLGHVVDMVTADPTAPVRVALEHPACNRSAGMALARERGARPARRAANSAWLSTELRQPPVEQAPVPWSIRGETGESWPVTRIDDNE